MTGDHRLGESTQRIIAESEIVVSTASIWEMVLKNSKGKLPLPQSSVSESLEAQGFILLPIVSRHIEALRLFDCRHPDPFDRVLLAQALDEKIILMTRDATILSLMIDGVIAG